MEECPLCKVNAELVGAIGKDEVIQICENCAFKNDFPIIRKPTQEQINKISRFYGVRERLMANLPSQQSSHQPSQPYQSSKFHQQAQLESRSISRDKESDGSLKKIVFEQKKETYEDLVDNFHWHIQHARRLKKISTKQLAEVIAEPEVAVEMAEKRQLPKSYSKLISKLEQFLGLKLRKNPEKSSNAIEEIFDIKKADLDSVTTTDLKKVFEGRSQTRQSMEDDEEFTDKEFEESMR